MFTGHAKFSFALFKVEHHPKMTRYAVENFSLREENSQLRSLEWVVQAEEAVTQLTAELEEAFHRAVETEQLTEGKTTPTSAGEPAKATSPQ